MKRHIIKTAVIAIIVVINIILIMLVINSTKDYIRKIKNGDIIQNSEDNEEYEDLDLKTMAKKIGMKLLDSLVFKVIILVLGIILLIIGIIIYLRI